MRFNIGRRWLCGRRGEVFSCSAGPDGDGICRYRNDCKPARNGEKIDCTRPKPCEQGPLPNGECSQMHTLLCRPELTLQAKRWQITFWMTVFSIALLCLLVSTTSFSPGVLSPSHRFLQDECESCHRSGRFGGIDVLMQAFAAQDHEKDDTLCLDCHRLGSAPLAVHNLDDAALTGISDSISTQEKSALHYRALVDRLPGIDHDVGCSRCHREHDGGDLLAAAEQTCIACHQQRFSHFREHPQFTEYPKSLQIRIKFGHHKHIAKYFDEEDRLQRYKPENCQQCHRLEGKGKMKVARFEQMCSDCHLSQIKGETQTAEVGIAVFNLPGIDIERLTAHGFVTGDWPPHADAELSAFMRLLLSGDQRASKAMAVLAGDDLMDLEVSNSEQLQAAYDLLWSIKYLFDDLHRHGHAALKKRVETALAKPLTAELFAGLAAALPPALLSQAVDQWLPNLTREMMLHRQGDFQAIKNLEPVIVQQPGPELESMSTMPQDVDENLLLTEDDDLILDDESLELEPEPEQEKQDIAESKLSEPQWLSYGGWYRQYETLYYRPANHGDQFLKAWLELSLASPQAEMKKLFEKLSKPKGQGMCMKCHAIDEANAMIHWRAKDETPARQTFSFFVHDHHLAIDDLKNCLHCHRLTTLSENDSKPKADANHGFKPIGISQCNDCHGRETVAAETCLTCHNYHIGVMKLTEQATPITVFEQRRNKE